jgi:hypothetical protein
VYVLSPTVNEDATDLAASTFDSNEPRVANADDSAEPVLPAKKLVTSIAVAFDDANLIVAIFKTPLRK